jgi:chromosome segregation ATPase
MKSDPQTPADLANLLRQQLILAQVRIMELEDREEEIERKLAETEESLRSAQNLADRKMEEADHLEKVRVDLQAQFEHMRHMQHVTHEALEATRVLLRTNESSLDSERNHSASLQQQLASETETSRKLASRIEESVRKLDDLTSLAAALQHRLEIVDAEMHAMKSSRSWRSTAWLRSLERLFHRR